MDSERDAEDYKELERWQAEQVAAGVADLALGKTIPAEEIDGYFEGIRKDI